MSPFTVALIVAAACAVGFLGFLGYLFWRMFRR
jgi:hypothetical protein